MNRNRTCWFNALITMIFLPMRGEFSADCRMRQIARKTTTRRFPSHPEFMSGFARRSAR